MFMHTNVCTVRESNPSKRSPSCVVGEYSHHYAKSVEYNNEYFIIIYKQSSQTSVNGWVTNNLLSCAPPCFRRHVKQLVSAAFAAVITHQSALGPRYWLFPVLHKEGLCLKIGEINLASVNLILPIKSDSWMSFSESTDKDSN
jgi:hypothetical protein